MADRSPNFDDAGKHLPKKLGKKPARHGAILFKARNYFDLARLPKPPSSFGAYHQISDWQDFDNSRFGNCVFAGAAHEEMVWALEGSGKVCQFSTEGVLADYAAVTGFDPKDPETDQGTDMGDAARYRRRTGIVDARGNRQTIDAYARLPLRRLDWLKTMMWLMGGVGLGFEFPGYAMEQFERGHPWKVQPKGEIDGGHYVCALGWTEGGDIVTVTWGKVQLMTPEFYERYSDEVIVYLDSSRLRNKVSPEGFHFDKLRSDLGSLGQVFSRKGPDTQIA
jgi:hypothetical protein